MKKVLSFLLLVFTVAVALTACNIDTPQTPPPEHEHTVVKDTAIEATCSSTGLTEGKHCSVCGEILVPQEQVPKKAHTEEIIPSVTSTCTSTGLTGGKRCTVCGEVLVAQETVDANNHEGYK